MADFFQSIVPINIRESELEKAADAVMDWLIETSILQPGLEKKSASNKTKNYLPGQDYWKITRQNAPDDLFEKHFNLIKGRTVFYPGQAELEYIKCNQCGFDLIDEDWAEAISNWVSGGPGFFSCLKCRCQEPIYHFEFNPDWAFGALGFEFWNWPLLDSEVVGTFAHLTASPCKLISGKL